MPMLVWHDLTALLYDGTSTSGGALAEARQPVSHERLTRMLPADWSGHTRLALAVRPCSSGARLSVLADTVIPTALCDG